MDIWTLSYVFLKAVPTITNKHWRLPKTAGHDKSSQKEKYLQSVIFLGGVEDRHDQYTLRALLLWFLRWFSTLDSLSQIDWRAHERNVRPFYLAFSKNLPLPLLLRVGGWVESEKADNNKTSKIFQVLRNICKVHFWPQGTELWISSRMSTSCTLQSLDIFANNIICQR